ncbi:hypothetical protein O7628_02735 [Micromonospora sp. WMMD956]|uniref:hypothetical protein n=1 Tax=Micromonospora sp. WMMD956 TaxID=3016108 RepID=UPI002417D104|nr:hypothetical protein [Micromonospora sp. WMMD956]MDG4814426.1 hypothetical protein [Micromonospora sp. WMMD956]
MTSEQSVLLDEVWRFLTTKDRWPTFAELDRRLYREHGLQADAILPALPSGLVRGARANGSAPFVDSSEVALTTAGVHATGRAHREITLFLAVVRYAADLEREYEPPLDRPEDRPRLTSAAVARQFNLDEAGCGGLLLRVGAILAAERWGWSGSSVSGSTWAFEVDRGVRRFTAVPDLQTYFQRQGEGERESRRGVGPLRQPPPAAGREAAAPVDPTGSSGLLLNVLAVALTAAGVAVAGLQVHWEPMRSLLLIVAITAPVLVWHRWRIRRRISDALLISFLCVGAAALVVSFVIA